MSRILVTGGAGYIGSHTVRLLDREGFDVVVVDDLSEGHREAVRGAELVVGDCGDRDVLAGVMSRGPLDAVIHFAGRCYVGESVREPRLYYDRNFGVTRSLLNTLVDQGTAGFLFSSTCAVYGDVGEEDLSEDLPRRPMNPYGRTKAMVEGLLSDYGAAYGLRSVCLRYFNAAGADPEGELGEDHDPETHLIPLVIRQALTGEGGLRVFGDDYPTPDGTCVRDYIHVSDLARAHVLAVRCLVEGGAGATVNLGTGRGHSVLEVIDAVGRRAGRAVEYEVVGRRPGDPARLVARPGRAAEILGWTPEHSDLDTMVDTAYRWHEAHPGGYA